jgi:hypothetical protein
MQIVLVLLFIVLGSVPAGERKCFCAKADDNDVPHGANEIVEFDSRTLKTIQGTVTLPNDEPVNNAVVEVYELTKANKDKSAYEIASTEQRKFACLPDQNGHFCLSDLSSGRYVLRIGTLQPAGVNEVFLKVRLERSRWKRWFRSGKPLEVVLTLGT